jgi:hypothetical protein
MGASSSKSSNDNDWELARIKAVKLYHYRVKNYNYCQHGPRDVYMVQVEAEYELECIPEYLRGRMTNDW